MDSAVGNTHKAESPPQPPITKIGTPLKKQASRLRVLEEERRSFRPDIYWYLSFRCNLACAHCSVSSSPWVDTSQDLKPEECMEVIEQMEELGVRSAILTGGEFLLRSDALQILRALEAKGIKARIESNGLRFDRAFIEVARDLQAKDLFNLTVSLDGGTRETHERLRGPRSFDRTLRGLKFLKENGIRFNIQCVLNGTNIDTVPNLYEMATELSPECAQVQFALLNPVGRGDGLVHEIGLKAEHIPIIFKTIKQAKQQYPGITVTKVPPAMVPPQYLFMVFNEERSFNTTSCQFPLLGILPGGDVTICAVSRNDDGLFFGNIRDSELRLKEIWEKTRMKMLRSKYVGAENLAGICGDCVWKYSCRGGCRAWAYEEGNSFDAPLPLCEALDEQGQFPKVYRLSHQNEVVIRKFQEMQTGCSCG